MSLSHAILGYLRRESMTGYDLKTRCFDKAMSYFWPADQAQIYRTLDKMEESGWVESRMEVQRDRPNRKWYSITETGSEELEKWLLSEQPLPIHREPYLVQLYFSDLMDDEAIIRLLTRQKTLHEAQLQEYQNIGAMFEAKDPSRELTLARLTLGLGIETEKAYISWAERAIQQLQDAGGQK